jgi:hypothetical protein
MKLVYAILADAAEVGPNGKTYLLGGEFENIFVPSFPALHSPLALLMRFDGEPAEFGIEHRLEVQVVDPDKVIRSPMLVMDFVPHLSEARPGPKDRPARLMLAVKFPALVLLRDGEYTFHIFLDGVEQDSVSLFAVQVKQGANSQDDAKA